MNRVTCLLVATLVAIVGSQASAEVIFQADFNSGGDRNDATPGANNLVGKGGSARLVDAEDGLTQPPSGIRASIRKDKPLGQGEYLHLELTEQHPAYAYNAGASFTPTAPANWYNAWVQGKGRDAVLVGAVDFLYRQDSAYQAQHSISHGGMPAKPTDGLLWTLFTLNEKQIRLALALLHEGKYDPNQAADADFQVQANTLYHIAVVFSSPAAGMTTGKLYIKTGGGAIDTSKDQPLVTLGPMQIDPQGIMADTFLAGPGIGASLGLAEYGWGTCGAAPAKPVSADFDAFRIWNNAQTTFDAPAAPVKP